LNIYLGIIVLQEYFFEFNERKEMKNIKLSIITLVTLSNIVYAGGDISPVTSYETNDVAMATEAYEEAIVAPVEEPVYVEPIPIKPKPIKESPSPTIKPITKSSAANGGYAGLGITGVKYSSACKCSIGGGSEENIAAIGRVGYDFNQYIGLEARGMTTVSGDGGADVEHMGLFIKPMLPVGDATNIYALIGAAKTTTTGSLQNVDAESLALGGGVEFDISADTPKEGRYSRSFDGQGDQERGVGLFIDYERLIVKKDAPDLDTISAGVTYDF
jgi:OOP family OmpA-OmpF porin